MGHNEFLISLRLIETVSNKLFKNKRLCAKTSPTFSGSPVARNRLADANMIAPARSESRDQFGVHIRRR